MTGQEAKTIRQNYGFTLEELAQILGYSQRGGIQRVEKMERVPNLYRSALLLLIDKCDMVRIYTDTFFKNRVSSPNHIVLNRKKRILKIYAKYEQAMKYFINTPCQNCSIYHAKTLNKSFCIQFEYKI